ncbi:MAG TPA: polysaccharide deacetylase family protein [Burkholderiaceae bacterium]|nr:polysaccharide deacetylase family protein [Burkholderiaceae bacterium]
MSNGAFVISLDFELFWGVRDKRSIASYGANLLGVRQAIPGMLKLFSRHRMHATFATVGMLACSGKKELLDHMPDCRPRYQDPSLDPYRHLDEVGDNEQSDPYHFAPSLVEQIRDTEGMDVGSHTFSHYYCLEPGAAPASFRADLEAAQQVFARRGIKPTSLVLPRNQYAAPFLELARASGITEFRGNPDHPFYRTEAQSQESAAKRLGRLLDSVVPVAGPLGAQPRMAAALPVDVPASFFLRPATSSGAVLDPLRLARIKSAMSSCAREGQVFHLWWHPHNFGTRTEANLQRLNELILHFKVLSDRYGFQSRTMAEVARDALGSAAPGATA